MTELDLPQARAAQNQSVFREVNAPMAEPNETFVTLTDSVFVCECADLACVEQIEIPLADYRRVRSDPRRFIVAPSEAHVLPDVEGVVECNGSYFVVQKIGAGSRLVEQTASR